MNSAEIWRPIAGHQNYEVSSRGGVRSLDRVAGGGFGNRTIPGMQLKPFICKQTGYPQVMLADRKKYNVHRLVAFAFCEGWAEGLIVNHKNGVKTDNGAENLEWVTYSQNSAHSFRVLGRVNPQRGRYGELHSTSKVVVRTDPATGKSKQYGSAMDAVREGFDSSCISRCCAGKIKTHKGYEWSFGVVWSEPKVAETA